MEGIKYVNLMEIGLVVIEIQGAENGKLVVPVNNTLVRHTAFLAADTRLCVLIIIVHSTSYMKHPVLTDYKGRIHLIYLVSFTDER